MLIIRKHSLVPDYDTERDELSRFFDVRKTMCMPAINVYENGQEYTIEVAAPGLKKEDFSLDIERDIMEISSSREMEQTGDMKVLRQEFCYEGFRRKFEIPDSVDPDQINATYDAGILRIILPKKEEAREKPPRTIGIS
ncbi:MAG: Hsp20/alpha crystallin family protein [Bacteroidales bacterium]|nr:Hsp20/alpha crystallin family protein [Bacteroidales bacterium]